MKTFIRYWRDKNGLPRGTMVATMEHKLNGDGVVERRRMIYGWSFCHKKDMRNGLFSKRAGKSYAYERMLRDTKKQNYLPRVMRKAWDRFREDACHYFMERINNARKERDAGPDRDVTATTGPVPVLYS